MGEPGPSSCTQRHRIVPHALNITQLFGVPFLIWGLVGLQVWPTVLGTLLVGGLKLWYTDRMVILYGDMVDAQPQLRYRRHSP